MEIDGGAIMTGAEDIGPGDEPGERPEPFRPEIGRINGRQIPFGQPAIGRMITTGGLGCFALGGREGNVVTLHQGMNGVGILLGDPGTLGMLINHKGIAVPIFAGQQDDRVMAVTVVHGGKPFGGATLVELADDVNVATERGEELAGSDVP